VKQFNLLEIVSTVVLLANVVVVVVDLPESSMPLTQATLQPVHRCTPAPYGTLAVPAALPTKATRIIVERVQIVLFFGALENKRGSHHMTEVASQVFGLMIQSR